jgi:hypothetical protein
LAFALLVYIYWYKIKYVGKMKVITNYLLGVLVMAIMLQSCKKDGNTSVYPSGQGSFTATGGLSLNLTSTYSTFKRVTTSTYDSIYVGGYTLTPQAIVGLTFVNVKVPITLPLNTATSSQTAIAGYFTGTNAASDYYFSTLSTTPGTVTITAISSIAIEGTYTTSVKNVAGTTISFSGTFKGSF